MKSKLDLKLLAFATTGYFKKLEKTINAGADINSIDDYGYSALTLSLSYGHLDSARLLIASGAYLDDSVFGAGVSSLARYKIKNIDNYNIQVNLLFYLATFFCIEKEDVLIKKCSSFNKKRDLNNFKNIFLKISSEMLSDLHLSCKFKIISSLIGSKDLDKIIELSFLQIYWSKLEELSKGKSIDVSNMSLASILKASTLLDFYQVPLLCSTGNNYINENFFPARNGDFNVNNVVEFAKMFFLNNPGAESSSEQLKKVGHSCNSQSCCALSIYNKAVSKSSVNKYTRNNENKKLKLDR